MQGMYQAIPVERPTYMQHSFAKEISLGTSPSATSSPKHMYRYNQSSYWHYILWHGWRCI